MRLKAGLEVFWFRLVRVVPEWQRNGPVGPLPPSISEPCAEHDLVVAAAGKRPDGRIGQTGGPQSPPQPWRLWRHVVRGRRDGARAEQAGAEV
jgi:hypothetical protein